MATLDRKDYDKHFQDNFRSAPYYQAERTWDDYGPAYEYGYASKTGTHRDRNFNDSENDLERGWEQTKANSRLAWSEAKEAVRDGWHAIERGLPGDADRDGR